MSRTIRPRLPGVGPRAHTTAHEPLRGRPPVADGAALAAPATETAELGADGGRIERGASRAARAGWFRRAALPALQSLGEGISVAHAPPAFVHIAGVPLATSALIEALGALSDARVQATPL